MSWYVDILQSSFGQQLLCILWPLVCKYSILLTFGLCMAMREIIFYWPAQLENAWGIQPNKSGLKLERYKASLFQMILLKCASLILSQCHCNARQHHASLKAAKTVLNTQWKTQCIVSTTLHVWWISECSHRAQHWTRHMSLECTTILLCTLLKDTVAQTILSTRTGLRLYYYSGLVNSAVRIALRQLLIHA